MKSWQKKLIKIVSPLLKKLEPDHGAAHSRVVFWWCLILTEDNQRVDKDTLFAAAWLHDLGHLKLKSGIENRERKHSDLSISLARSILKKAGVSEKKAKLIKEIIKVHEENLDLLKMKLPLECLIFHDADKMDSLGALGIARQFVYSGRVNKKFWDPSIPRNASLPWGGNFSAMHTILDSQMNLKFYTKKGKRISEDRKRYMHSYIKRFFQEWDFKK
ncbi:hypothetical protein AMJ48_03020 [Parcubacteria bacterium DG_74_1]|nr:MAG: hypothetical protein AMJ48_03020 [Parcubacteria bacterium DG_74_1]